MAAAAAAHRRFWRRRSLNNFSQSVWRQLFLLFLSCQLPQLFISSIRRCLPVPASAPNRRTTAFGGSLSLSQSVLLISGRRSLLGKWQHTLFSGCDPPATSDCGGGGCVCSALKCVLCLDADLHYSGVEVDGGKADCIVFTRR